MAISGGPVQTGTATYKFGVVAPIINGGIVVAKRSSIPSSAIPKMQKKNKKSAFFFGNICVYRTKVVPLHAFPRLMCLVRVARVRSKGRESA